MKYNEKVAEEYGSFKKISISNGFAPLTYKPIPSSSQYVAGYISRTFLFKLNDSLFFQEIDPTLTSYVNRNLYEIVTVEWKINGPKNKVVVDGIIEDRGVMDYNSEQISRMQRKSRGVQLNPLEFWRGY